MPNDEPYTEASYDDESAEFADGRYDDTAAEENESRWDDGLVALLLISGVILFVFPEPATSMLGIALIVLGVIAWAADALM